MKCLCCDNENLFLQEAVMAPFISKITNQQAINTSLNFCMKCGFSFFQHRYSESELNLIYSGYRGDYYQKLRQTVEPNYSQKINDGLGGVEIANQRKKPILDNLKKCSINPNSILDYGGDRGQMIPTSLINDESYVYDLSNENLVHGVKRLEFNEIRLKSIDLVMINHTLEHMTDFVSDLDELIKDLADGVYIYRASL